MRFLQQQFRRELPARATIPVADIGKTLQFTGVFDDQMNYFLTASAQWSSTNPAVAAVFNYPEVAGAVTFLAAGAATIRRLL